MLIEAGFDVAFECPAATPMILQLSIHPSRDADLLTPDRIVSDPSLPMRSYLDLFGNRVTRVEAPGGLVTFSDRFIIQDSGEPDETPPDVRTTPIVDLPDETLSRRNHANQPADRPVDTLHATTAIPVARFQAPLHTLSRSPGASFAPTTITGVKIKSP